MLIAAATSLAVATPANADTAQSLAGPNMWIVKELATDAAINGGQVAVDQFTKANVNGPTANMPIAGVSQTTSTAARSKGFTLRGRGIGGALLSVAAFAGMDLLLAGDGAPDPADTLPAPEVGPALPAGWTATPQDTFYADGGYYQWSYDVVATTASSATVAQTLSHPGPRGEYWMSAGGAVQCRGVADPPGSGAYYGGSQSLDFGSGNATRTGTCPGGMIVDFVQVGRGTDIAKWFPEGNPLRPVPAEDDADEVERQATAEITCRQPDGSPYTMTAVSNVFTLAQVRDGLIPHIPAMPCPDGGSPETVKPGVTTPAPSGPMYTPLAPPVEVPERLRERLPSIADGTDPGLELERIPAPGQNPRPCIPGETACRGWWQDPVRDDTYQCKDGGVVVPLSECEPYKNAFEPGEGLDPDAEAESQKCWPSGWGMLNPLEWVYRPVSCALTSAFVPTRSDTTLTGIRTTMNESAPVVWFNAFSDPFDGWSIEGAGCRGPGFELWGVGVYVFSACDAPMSNVAAVTKAFATVAVAIFGGYACLRGILVGFSISLPRLGGGSGGD